MDELSNAKVACLMNGIYLNHLMYDDDVVLIAPSIHAQSGD